MPNNNNIHRRIQIQNQNQRSRLPFSSGRSKSSSKLSSSRVGSSALHAILPEGYQEFGEEVIRRAGAECGVQKDEELTIEWKAGRILVTVHGKVFVSTTKSASSSEDEDEDETDDADDIVSVVDENEADENDDDDQQQEQQQQQQQQQEGVDVTEFAKLINRKLDNDGDLEGVGFAIAEVHEIEVTTPGATDELLGGIMFEAYRGFDVICQQEDSKTKKIKTIEGRLVERNDEFTVINIKGRMKKMRNDTVRSVKLPKAKKEKGAK